MMGVCMAYGPVQKKVGNIVVTLDMYKVNYIRRHRFHEFIASETFSSFITGS